MIVIKQILKFSNVRVDIKCNALTIINPIITIIKKVKDKFIQNRNSYLKLEICKLNLATNSLNNSHAFSNLENVYRL